MARKEIRCMRFGGCEGMGREGLVMRKSGGKVKPPDRIPATVSDTISWRIVHSGSYFAG